jgi:hypothetical protein
MLLKKKTDPKNKTGVIPSYKLLRGNEKGNLINKAVHFC